MVVGTMQTDYVIPRVDGTSVLISASGNDYPSRRVDTERFGVRTAYHTVTALASDPCGSEDVYSFYSVIMDLDSLDLGYSDTAEKLPFRDLALTEGIASDRNNTSVLPDSDRVGFSDGNAYYVVPTV